MSEEAHHAAIRGAMAEDQEDFDETTAPVKKLHQYPRPASAVPAPSALDRVDLAFAVIDEVVVPLHHVLELLPVVRGHLLRRHHLLERPEVRHFHFRDRKSVV